jgi:preprotein translocase subunit YajC
MLFQNVAAPSAAPAAPAATTTTTAQTQQTQPDAGPAGCGDPKQGILLIVMIFAIFYFIVFRPQQKRVKDQQRFLDNLQKDQQVVTQGGLIGKITGFRGPEVILEVQEKIRVRVLRSSIASQFPPPGAQAKNVSQPAAGKDKDGGKDAKDKDASDDSKDAKADKSKGSDKNGKRSGGNDPDSAQT